MAKVAVQNDAVTTIRGGATFLQNLGPGDLTISRSPEVEADEDVVLAATETMALPAALGNRPLYVISDAADTDLRYL